MGFRILLRSEILLQGLGSRVYGLGFHRVQG